MIRHKSPRYMTRIAHAPYNFVPLPDKVYDIASDPRFDVEVAGEARKIWETHDRWVESAYCGWIDLDIVTETPLYVRCGVRPEEAQLQEPRANPHRQHFYHHGDPQKPWIPGSTLRGMTRSLVEIMSSARFGPFSDRHLVYRAVGDMSSLGDDYRYEMTDAQKGELEFDYPTKRMKAGWLRFRDGRPGIQPAEEHERETFVHVPYAKADLIIGHHGQHHEHHEVWVKPSSRRGHPRGQGGGLALRMAFTEDVYSRDAFDQAEAAQRGLVLARLVESGHMTGKTAKKMHCAIYQEVADRSKWREIDRSLWKRYEEDDSQHSHARATGRPSDRIPRPLQEGSPLFYLMERNDPNKLKYFGTTMMFRLPYPQSIAAFVPDRLRTNDGIDLAQAIFGTLAGRTIKGRVFFGAARWTPREDGESPFLGGRDGGLRSPKILGGPKPTAFQMYLEQPQPDDTKSLRHWNASPNEISIRGSKRYWHRKLASEEQRFEGDLKRDSTQHTIVQPVKPKACFSSRVRFENLAAIELGALLTALDLPESKRHHIGMGKPYGMGSVRIRPTLHIITRNRRVKPESDTESPAHWRYEHFFDKGGATCRGDLGDADTEAVRRKACSEFQGAMATLAGAASFWEVPHLRELEAMLEWESAPPSDATEYMGLEAFEPVPPNTPSSQQKWWRRRPVLPHPSKLNASPLGFSPPPSGSGSTGTPNRVARPPQRDQGHGPRRPSNASSSQPLRSEGDRVKAGATIRCVLLEERTKKNGPRFRHEATGLKGFLGPKSDPIPDTLSPGSEVELVVVAAGTELQLEYRLPKPEKAK